jgi:hypothetical protein
MKMWSFERLFEAQVQETVERREKLVRQGRRKANNC